MTLESNINNQFNNLSLNRSLFKHLTLAARTQSRRRADFSPHHYSVHRVDFICNYIAIYQSSDVRNQSTCFCMVENLLLPL